MISPEPSVDKQTVSIRIWREPSLGSAIGKENIEVSVNGRKIERVISVYLHATPDQQPRLQIEFVPDEVHLDSVGLILTQETRGLVDLNWKEERLKIAEQLKAKEASQQASQVTPWPFQYEPLGQDSDMIRKMNENLSLEEMKPFSSPFSECSRNLTATILDTLDEESNAKVQQRLDLIQKQVSKAVEGFIGESNVESVRVKVKEELEKALESVNVGAFSLRVDTEVDSQNPDRITAKISLSSDLSVREVPNEKLFDTLLEGMPEDGIRDNVYEMLKNREEVDKPCEVPVR